LSKKKISTSKSIVMVLAFKIMALMVIYFAFFKPIKRDIVPQDIYETATKE